MRYELTDYEWVAIKPFLPNKPRGVPLVNDRRVLNAALFFLLRFQRLRAQCAQHIAPRRLDQGGAWPGRLRLVEGGLLRTSNPTFKSIRRVGRSGVEANLGG